MSSLYIRYAYGVLPDYSSLHVFRVYYALSPVLVNNALLRVVVQD